MKPEDLSDKFRRLKKSLPGGVTTGADLLKKKAEKEPPDMTRFIPGEVRSCDQGDCFVTDEFYPFDDTFGNYPLDQLVRLDAQRIIDTFELPGDGRGEGGRILFIDTETTGLSGGTGTYAFQVGIGWVEEGGFRVLQYFMRDYDEEPAQMTLLAKEFEDCALMVTYNGGPFDLPLLKTRFIFNRLRVPLDDLPHLDLLPVARRLWKPAYGAANLSFLEEKVLGNEREGDVSGALIPSLYFQFVRGASPRSLEPVFYHNRMDIVALAAMADLAYQRHTDFESFELDWERLGVARFFEKKGREAEALDLLRPVLSEGADNPAWVSCCRLASLLAKRLGQWMLAVELWEKICEQPHFDPVIRLELAKYFEHKAKEMDQARTHVLAVFEGYGIEPDEESEEGEATDDTEDSEDFRYDFSEGVASWDDVLPVRRTDRESDEVSHGAPARVPVPRLTARFRADLNHRLARLNRKRKK